MSPARKVRLSQDRLPILRTNVVRASVASSKCHSTNYTAETREAGCAKGQSILSCLCFLHCFFLAPYFWSNYRVSIPFYRNLELFFPVLQQICQTRPSSLYLHYSKTSFLVQIKFITEDLQQTQTQTLIIN